MRELCELGRPITLRQTCKNLGAAENYNRIVHVARGEYFKWAAHDDNCYSDFLSECVTALDRNPDAVLCYPSTHVIDGNGEVLSEYRDNLDLPQDSSHERLVGYLRNNFMRKTGMCNPIFGVIRTAPLRKTRLIQEFLASDRLLLAPFLHFSARASNFRQSNFNVGCTQGHLPWPTELRQQTGVVQFIRRISNPTQTLLAIQQFPRGTNSPHPGSVPGDIGID